MRGATLPRSVETTRSGGRLPAWLRRLVPLVVPLAMVGAIVLLAALGSPFIQRRVTLGLIDLVAVVGLYIFVGNSGVLSFGHVGFMAIGAYASALLTMRPATKAMFLPQLPDIIAHASLNPWLGGAVGAAAAGLFALLAGSVLMRLSGMAASIATFALLVIVYVVLGNWDAYTGGQRSLMGVPAVVGLWSAFAVGALALAVAFAYGETRSALALRASREDAVAAAGSGVSVYRRRLEAFVLSAVVSGMAGALMAHLLGSLRVDAFYLDLTFTILAMLVVGGSRSLAGAVVGTVVIMGLAEGLRALEAGIPVAGTLIIAAPAGLGDVLLALVMLLMIIFRPSGLMAGREFTAWAARSASPG